MSRIDYFDVRSSDLGLLRTRELNSGDASALQVVQHIREEVAVLRREQAVPVLAVDSVPDAGTLVLSFIVPTCNTRKGNRDQLVIRKVDFDQIKTLILYLLRILILCFYQLVTFVSLIGLVFIIFFRA